MKSGKITFVFLFLFSLAGIFAQVASDPLDYFYDDLVIWETMGLVGNLPAARPYPLQLVAQILDTVIERGDSTQRGIAIAHRNRLLGKNFSFGLKTGGAINADTDKQINLAAAFDMNMFVEKYVSISASVDAWATNKLFDDELLPAAQESTKDIISDNAKVGPFWVLPSVNSSMAIGTTDYYLNAGLMRGSYGPFHYNGVIVGPQALHSGQYDFAVNKTHWGYNLSLYSLSATDAEDSETFYPEKFLTVHSLDYRPFDWLSVSLLESIVFGNRLETMYLLPMSPYMISQGNTGFRDNSWIGGMFTVKPIGGLKIDGVLYADDLSFNDIVKLNFDTKWRLAGQLGASWAPRESGIFTLVSVDYTMVTPYAYSHRNDDEDTGLDEVNYQNYLHAGKSFGADLNPNSDRVNLKLKLRPLEDLDVDLVGTLIRHGNVNEGIEDKWIVEYLKKSNKYVTDGSILNPSASGVGHAFFYSTPFLTQQTLQYIWQTGFDVNCRLPVLKSGGYMVFRFGYRFEYNINDGINSQLYPYDSSLDDASDETVLAAAAEKLSAWRENATGTETAHIISVGFEYFFR